MSQPLRLPAGIEDVDTAWLQQAISADGRTASVLASFSAEALEEDALSASSVYRLRLVYKEGPASPASVVLKLGGPRQAGPLAQFNTQMYQLEVEFYRAFAGTRTVPMPALYFGASSPEDGRMALLIEDLAARDGGYVGSGRMTASEGDARMALLALGRMHAAWWGAPGLARYPWLRTIKGTLKSLLPALTDDDRKAVPKFMERMGDLVPQALRPVVERMPHWLERVWTEAADEPQTLIHGDCAAKNIYFHPLSETHPATLFDWALAGTGPATVDAANFIGQSMSPGTIESSLDSLIDHHYGVITANTKTRLTADAYQRQFRHAALMRLIPPVGNGSRDVPARVAHAREITPSVCATVLACGAQELVS